MEALIWQRMRLLCKLEEVAEVLLPGCVYEQLLSLLETPSEARKSIR